MKTEVEIRAELAALRLRLAEALKDGDSVSPRRQARFKAMYDDIQRWRTQIVKLRRMLGENAGLEDNPL